MEERRIVLKDLGNIDPVSAEEYAQTGGYQALERALSDPRGCLEIIRASGIRGYGGAGFPVGVKWASAAEAPSEQKYIVCNADEGEPGTNKDRVLLSGIPHRVFEGMAIAAAITGASEGYLYLRAEYACIRDLLTSALADARAKGFLGNNILETGFSFDIEVRLAAGSYVCGEETALLESLEGRRGQSRPKPPFPTVQGLWGKPTVINNVETLANIPPLLLNGAEWYQANATKLFTLSGNISRPGVYEFPFGVSLRTLFEDVGGGCPGGKGLAAIQTGGASGRLIPGDRLDIPMDPAGCAQAGATFGAGDLMFIDEEQDLLGVLENLAEFFEAESCGKCTPCREGTSRLTELIGSFRKGTATYKDVEMLRELGELMTDCSLCGLGKAAPLPVLSGLEVFPELFEVGKNEREVRP